MKNNYCLLIIKSILLSVTLNSVAHAGFLTNLTKSSTEISKNNNSFGTLLSPKVSDGDILILGDYGQLNLLGFAIYAQHNPNVMNGKNIFDSYRSMGSTNKSDTLYLQYNSTRDAFKRRDLENQIVPEINAMIQNYKGFTSFRYPEYRTNGRILKSYDFNKHSFALNNVECGFLTSGVELFSFEGDLLGRKKNVIKSYTTLPPVSPNCEIEVTNENQARKIENEIQKENIGLFKLGLYSAKYTSEGIKILPLRADIIIYNLKTGEKLASKPFILLK